MKFKKNVGLGGNEDDKTDHEAINKLK